MNIPEKVSQTPPASQPPVPRLEPTPVDAGGIETASVSVVIPHYGNPEPTRALCSKLRGQAHQVIVVDDASPTPFPTTPGVDVIRRPVNGGFGAACNSGAEAAHGHLLLFLNSDADVSDHFVSEFVAAAAPWQPCVAGPRIIEHGRSTESARFFPGISEQVVEWLTPLARFHGKPWMSRALRHDVGAARSNCPCPTDWVVGAALLIPRVHFQRVGGFDERFYMNSEEVDLQRRLLAEGVPSVYVPGVSITHASGGSSASTNRVKWLVDSRRTYAAKWGSERALQMGLSAATVINFAWNTARRFRGRTVNPKATFASQWDAIWGLSRRGDS